MSSELETLDQLLGGPLSLQIIRELFVDEQSYVRAVGAMLRAGNVRLVDNGGADVPLWQWHAILAQTQETDATSFRLAITSAGIRRIA